MYVGSSVAAISAAISAAVVYFRVRGNKLSHRKWQLHGNYAILATNNQRVFWYENGELNGVQFLFFDI